MNTSIIARQALLTLVLWGSIYSLSIAQIQPLPNPAATNSFTPKLHLSPKGKVYLSWQTKNVNQKHSLWVSSLKGEKWTAPRQAATETQQWFVNWADFPAVTTFGKRSLAVNYLQKSASSTYAYDVMLRISHNKGKTWQKPFVAHQDGTHTEHGFVSLAPAPNGRFLAVWLDGRETAKRAGESHGHSQGHGASKKAMTLRAAFFDGKGNKQAPTLLNDWVCDCCQTSVAPTKQGYVVVYRGRSKGEVRDIACQTYKNGRWTSPYIIHSDGWVISGCPVNGPSVSANGNQVTVAWYTKANKKAKVQVAFSDNGGESFSLPTQVNEGSTVGRVACAALPNGDALVVWLETNETKTFIKLRRVSTQGKAGKVYIVSQTSSARSSGFPQIIVQGKRAILAWTLANKKSKVLKTATYAF
ncbi:sialidase family protein [uncultured Microscilla sp.]|uniref:sialidase family protein n=1 Tax=uncultured Microscilla sp. TaxID=432653 RepID=UPI0026333C5E|nr:sialidase family protein [uncultured Microscilla sp.]